MPSLRTSRFLLFFLFFGNVWKVLPKSIPDRGPLEVLIRVQVFDNSDLSPLPDATVEVHGNQSTPSTGRAGSDGIATVTLLYRPGTWVIIAASKPGYVTNSAPWHAKRIPLYASISLYLLPQRPATLILYEDVVQVLLGSPGSRRQPWVQFQRRAIGLTLNSTYAELTAMLTAAKSQYEIGGFPYPLGQESANSTGSDIGWADLTAVAAVSAHLLDQNGTVVQVSDPVHISIPLPSDTPVRAATSVPVWRFEAQKGLWVRNGTGYIKKDGTQMTWSFVASQLGYWLAAFPTDTGMAVNPPGLGDITTYHTIFLLAILGSLALLVLVLLCLLLYHCRRRCLKPRQQHHKLQVSSALDGSRRDQGTSTSHLHLISSGRPDAGTACAGDADGLKTELTSRDEFFRDVPAHKSARVNTGTYTRRGEGFPPKPANPGDARNQDKRRNGGGGGGSANDNQGYASDPPSPPPAFAGRYQDSRPPEYSASQPADPLARANTQPGQLIFCSSMDQMNESMYRSVVPTLVIPAHYMRLSSDLSAVEQALEQQQLQQQDREGIQVSVTLPRPRGAPGQQGPPQQQQQQQQQQGQRGGLPQQQQEGEDAVRIPVLFDDSAMSQMSEELQALTEQKLLELGVKPHPRAWFVSLDGRSNSLVRHSYIELGNERGGVGLGGVGGGSRPGDGVGPAPGRAESRGGRQPQRTPGERRGRAAKAYARPACANDPKTAAAVADGEGRAAPSSPEDNSLAPLLDEAPGPRGATFPRRGPNSSRAGGGGGGGGTRRSSATSPEVEENDLDDKDDDGENKKSPWQRREERPLMVFNVK
ncbi:protein FAM171A2-like [Anguilla rostrata]|uniref:protein FAM171A2-like n=1 Tax=Anguilla rostrata TaxID=7938 RepID=UPI0030CBD26B